ncbi:ABC transporter permease [Fictibacillus nanhaiensis]|uniref:ABC transporter permease n=1 Tax=Fictibacillus nanhaiensis TaxID=742169 RepID=UPI001C95E18C|nr:ABC transporter permease [Fictibacillus nanhaiensis]MBY6038057.1 ABC transporter permease [Fictibacillus nanhaiensis]
MLKFIWNSWWRNKEKFILVLVGVLILSIGLSYLVGITQANNGTIVDELQKRWKSSYDIVVRPQGSRSVTEDLNLLEPNYLSGLSGGITMEQYEKIRKMDSIEIAAPIAMIGFTNNDVKLDQVNVTIPGVYRLKMTEMNNNGVIKEIDEGDFYFTVGKWKPSDSGKEYGTAEFDGSLSYGSYLLLAGVDPEEEAKLVGLDKAIIKSENSRYFIKGDTAEEISLDATIKDTSIPVIMSKKEYADSRISFVVEKLDIPFQSGEQQKSMENVRNNGGLEFLKKQKGIVVEKRTFTTSQAQKKVVEQIMNNQSTLDDHSKFVALKPSPVDYRPIDSPFKDRWTFSYEITPFTLPEDSLIKVDQAYRHVNMFGDDFNSWLRLRVDPVGIFDPTKIKISKDPLTELPMETYFPAKAQLVMDADETPVNPPRTMKPENNPYGFLTKPPTMLTTLDAAAKLLGDKPIASIRIKVKGVNQLNKESEKLLKQVAKEIEKETGLITDITLGSSPQPALTHVPGIEKKKSIGWVEQPWIKLGSSISIFKETKVGASSFIITVLLVAIVYVFSSNLIMMYARKKEYAVLLSLGWRPNQLSKLLFIESTILGSIVSIISWLILGYIYLSNDIDTSTGRILLIGVFGLFIYWIGTLVPAMLVRNIQPYESMKAGEISKGKRYFKSQTPIGISNNYMLTRWKRSVLSILSIALPSTMLIFFIFVTFRLKGVMYATWLGQYVALEVGPMHYLAMGIAMAIAILTTLEIIWQNVVERQPEFAVLKALGWRDETIRRMILFEGGMNGLIAGIIGLLLALLTIIKVYGQFPTNEFFILLATIIIPILAGGIGAVIPSIKAVKIQPYQGLGGGYNNSRRAEKRFKYVFAMGGACLFAGIILLLGSAIPVTINSANTSETADPVQGTKGKVIEVYKTSPSKEKPDKKNNNVTGFSAYYDSAYERITAGEQFSMKNDFTDEIYFTIDIGKDLSSKREDKPKEGYKFISVPFTFTNYEEVTWLMKPYTFQLIDSKGNKYNAKDWKVIEKENWRGLTQLVGKGKASLITTYEVPEQTDNLILVLSYTNLPGDIVVDIK